ncbi:hypothetical protein CI610_01962 [invertebrate metagenome]|uniref:Uncharacterized protein n=1 Tax=invertebrate metagenome TaxID=1711999 RepID=A0A2H9T788_9ZZZZ
MSGYIFPLVMGIMAILSFSMMGILEMSQVEERAASNEQQRLRVEEAARSELERQAELLNNHTSLRNKSSRALTPILYPNGCNSSSGKDAICQQVSLNYLRDLSRPAGMPSTKGKFQGWRFRLDSEAENIATGARSKFSLELSYIKLDLWEIRDVEIIPADKRNDYAYVSQKLEFEIPEWWELEIHGPVTRICFLSRGGYNAKAYVSRHTWNGSAHGEWSSGEMPIGQSSYFISNEGDMSFTVYMGSCGLSGFSQTCKYNTTNRVNPERGKDYCYQSERSLFNPYMDTCSSTCGAW